MLSERFGGGAENMAMNVIYATSVHVAIHKRGDDKNAHTKSHFDLFQYQSLAKNVASSFGNSKVKDMKITFRRK